jgi:hypothetical protein
MYSSWDGVSTDWDYQLQPSRLIFDLLHSSPEEQRFLSNWFRQDQIWFALIRTSLAQNTKRILDSAGQVVMVFKRESLVAGSKSSFRSDC